MFLKENIEGNIELKDIDFCYPTRPNIKVILQIIIFYKNIFSLIDFWQIKSFYQIWSNFSISWSEVIVIIKNNFLIFFSGSGKSSIISLIQRFYDPLNGLIKIDNYNIKDLNIKWIRNQVKSF